MTKLIFAFVLFVSCVHCSNAQASMSMWDVLGLDVVMLDLKLDEEEKAEMTELYKQWNRKIADTETDPSKSKGDQNAEAFVLRSQRDAKLEEIVGKSRTKRLREVSFQYYLSMSRPLEACSITKF